MKNQLVPVSASSSHLPALVATSGEQAARRFLEFFASNIRNRNTRIAYSHAVCQQSCESPPVIII